MWIPGVLSIWQPAWTLQVCAGVASPAGQQAWSTGKSVRYDFCKGGYQHRFVVTCSVFKPNISKTNSFNNASESFGSFYFTQSLQYWADCIVSSTFHFAFAMSSMRPRFFCWCPSSFLWTSHCGPTQALVTSPGSLAVILAQVKWGSFIGSSLSKFSWGISGTDEGPLRRWW